LKDWSDGRIFRALRNGIDKDGRWLIAMSNARCGMADEGHPGGDRFPAQQPRWLMRRSIRPTRLLSWVF
jgi:hypothetical protein